MKNRLLFHSPATPRIAWTRCLGLIAAFLLAFAPNTFANNFRSGDITYKNLGNGDYVITATVYYDCDSMADPPRDPLYVFAFGDSTGAGLGVESLPKISEMQLGADDLADFCFCGPDSVLPCVNKVIYSDTISIQLTGGATNPNYEGIEFVINESSRSYPNDNLTIQYDGFTLKTTAPDDNDLPGNNSPTFDGPNVKIACQQDRCINLSGTDPDIAPGSSPHNRLDYQFADPLTYSWGGSDATVTWGSGHSASDFLGDGGNATLHTSGILCFEADTLDPGTYLFSVNVNEYIEDPNNPGTSLLIGTTTRDYQLVVLEDCPCCPVSADFSTGQYLCSGDITGFDAVANDSCPDQVAHYWDFGDGSNRWFVEDPAHNYQGSGTFTAQHIADNGCASETLEVEIYVADCCVDGYRTDNQVNNGLFEDTTACGTLTFDSDMTDDCYNASLADNHYALVRQADERDPDWEGEDNSGLDGFFFLGNGDDTNRMAWEQDIYLGQAATYCLCVDVKNVCTNCGDDVTFRLWADGNIILTSNAIAYSTQWTTLCANFSVASAGGVTVGIEVLGTQDDDNAFGLDNIYVRRSCSASIGFGKGDAPAQEVDAMVHTVYPNPVRLGEPLTIEYASEKADQVQVEITDMSGKQVWTQRLQVLEGVNALSINMRGIPTGAYHINVASENAISHYNVLVIQ